MSFVNPIFLIALVGALVPLLIHLLTRDRIQHVAFSTLRFFVKGARHVIRRKRFQELLLLLMRAAVAALLALIFARPFLQAKRGADNLEAGTTRVIVADLSGSMRRPGLQTALRAEVLDALDSLKEGQDTALLLAFSDAPRFEEPAGGLAALRAAAQELAPGYGGTNIGDALRRANDRLRNARTRNKEIVLISDLQRSGWGYFKGDWRLAGDVKIIVKQLKPSDDKGDLAIVEGDVPQALALDRLQRTISVRVANYSDEPRTNVEVTLTLNDKKLDTQRCAIRARGTSVARFRHVFDTSGDNLGVVSIAAEDAFTENNVFRFNARTIPRIPVLVVNGRPSPNPQSDAAFFIEKALAPSEESPFTVKTVLADKATAGDVAQAMVAVLANVGKAPAALTDALAALLQRGGGVFLLPGDQASAESFNTQFARLAPCKLRQALIAKPANGETAESLTRLDFDHPIFEIFSRPHYGDLSLPKFLRYWETTDTQLSRVLARFGDGRPAILERQIDNGVSMALVSAVDVAWNDFAYQSVFLPYLHQTVRYLAVRTEKRTGYTSGDLLPVAASMTLRGPDGKPLPEGDATAGAPGFYALAGKSGSTEFTYAVNPSLAEADPTTVPPDEIAVAIERAPGETAGASDAEATAKDKPERKDRGAWWYLLCGLLGLTLAELVVGNKTIRH